MSGEARSLAMFPLGSVLLPTTVLPLRIFEPRYLQLLTDTMEASREFGVTLIERGHEVGGGDMRSDLGAIAQIVDAQDAGDGLWHVVAVGTRRIRVQEWLEDDPYPRAMVELLPEPPAVEGDAERYTIARRGLTTLLALASEAGRGTIHIPELADDPALGSYQVAAVAPFGPFDRQRILGCATPSARLELVTTLLAEHEADLRAELGLG